MRTPPDNAPARAGALHAELRRFALQVQWGFTLTLALCLVMLAIHG